MALIGLVSFLVAASGGTNFALVFSALGGLSGLAALATVWVNYRTNQRKATQDDKSVAIVELEKAVPGLGEIIKEWQAVVGRLQEDLSSTKRELAESKRESEATQVELAECHKRIDELERLHQVHGG